MAVGTLMIVLGMRFLRKRHSALHEANFLAYQDSRRYMGLWEELCKRPGFHQSLTDLSALWGLTMKGASSEPKRQKSSSIETLFNEADALNPLLQQKALQWASGIGRHYAAPVKNEKRALQKVYRSYKGDWTRLCDLARTSLIFSTLEDLAECLKVIASDQELELIVVSDDKMRFSMDYDESRSGGYRDVQLSGRLKSQTARSLELHNHIFEIQLHLEDVYALKSDGGHKIYMRARNLRGD